MTLSEHMAAKGLRDKQVAHDLKVSRPFITQLRNGSRYPSLELAVAISEWSGGAVKPADLLKKPGA